jgi:DNA-binding transcriptional MerR regulator
MLTPIQVAKKANVSVNSVRNWSREYADLLSLEARGENGPRLFSEEDAETICTIAALRKSGVPPTEIADRISNQDVPPIVDAIPEPLQSTLQEPTTALQMLQDAPLALHVAHNALQSRVESLERRVEADIARIELQQRERLNMLVTGIVIGAGVVLIVVAVVLATAIQ